MKGDLSKKRKLLIVVLFPGLVLLFLFGWILYFAGGKDEDGRPY